jgi:hypothetical protein
MWLGKWIRVSRVKMVLVAYIYALETNPYFIVCSSLELKLIYVRDVNNGIS